MPIIDAQIHDAGPFWDWQGESDDIQHRIMGELAIAYLDALAVDRAVLFPGWHDPHTDWLCRQLPDRFTYVPHVSPDDDIEAIVTDARDNPGIAGLRTLIGWPLDGTEARRLEAGAWDPVFASCESHGVPVFLFITGWLEMATRVAEGFPNLKLIVDHMGLRQPPMDVPDDPPFAKLQQLIDLARFPNVNVKLCGLPAMSMQAFPYKDVNGALREIVDAFGADRLMWASDTTRFRGRIGIGRYQNPDTLKEYQGKHSYAQSLLYIRENEVLSEAEKEAILGGTAARVLGWN